MPFGGAYVALAGVHEAWELITGTKTPEGGVSPDLAGGRAAAGAVSDVSGQLSRRFARLVGSFFKTSFVFSARWSSSRFAGIARSPLLQRILHSRLFTLVFRFLVKPLVWTGVVWWLSAVASDWRYNPVGAAAHRSFSRINLLLNSQLGHTVEEMVVDGIVQGWRRFGCV